MADPATYATLSAVEPVTANTPLAVVNQPALVPPPADAPDMREALLKLIGSKSLSGFWTYRDKDSLPLFGVGRVDTDKGKAIYPVSWQEGGGWVLKAWSTPKPLYNLHHLTARQHAPVVVVEGEKAVDAAAQIFPNSVVVTSAGGSNQADKSDWEPLAGRKVLIWPDADSPGAKYAGAVRDRLLALGCEVHMVNAAEVASMMPDGSRCDPLLFLGFDAADALTRWEGRLGLKEVVTGASQPLAAPEPAAVPMYLSHGEFTMSAKGLYKAVEGKDGELRDVLIAGAFEVLGRARDQHGMAWGQLLRWSDNDSREHRHVVLDADLQSPPLDLCRGLADRGLSINSSHQKSLQHYLSACRSDRRIKLVGATGWHEHGNGLAFVLPSATLGDTAEDTVMLSSGRSGAYAQVGTLSDWQAGVARLANGHDLAVIAISAALAGPLLLLTGSEGGGINIHGRSSTGKTTALQCAASVWGRGATPGYVQQWRATANGLEGAAALASDTVLCLDELGVAEAREVSQTLYSLGNGSGKIRADRTGDARQPKTWRLLWISTAEVAVDQKLSEDRGRKAKAGQLVRMLDVPADRGLGYGCFNHVDGYSDGSALADALKTAAQTSYGTAGPAFVAALIGLGLDQATIRARAHVEAFERLAVPVGSDGQVQRAARRFALIVAAGSMAHEFGIVPWTSNQITLAALWALGQWVEHRGGPGPAEERQAIEQVQSFMAAHGSSRFELDVKDSGIRIFNRAGWIKGNDEYRRYLVSATAWKAEVCAGLNAQFVADVLARNGMLDRGSDGKTSKVEHLRSTGGTARVYVLTPAVLSEEYENRE
jgi:uncharacterized protein (DUF927 family)/5S rRNA maturation endonuclease (ribonuclease M5)